MRKSKKRNLILLIIVGLMGAGFWIYWEHDPAHHFNRANMPVLVEPEAYSKAQEFPMSKDQKRPPEQIDITTKQQPQLSRNSFNVLLLGIDSRESEISRADMIMLAHVIPEKKEVRLVSVPRDTRVFLSKIGFTKVNHAHVIGEMDGGNEEGTKRTLQAVSNLLQVPIHYYVKTDFKGFVHLIDSMGGIDVDLPAAINLSAFNIVLDKGQQHLDGDLALKLARERHSLSDGDFGRQSHQAMIVKAALHKLLLPSNLAKLPFLLASTKDDLIDTNLTNSDMISLAWLFTDLSPENIKYIRITGKSAMMKDAIMNMELYYIIPDDKDVESISRKYLQDDTAE
jgi:polyisoprenyl-teichoic acid--peptidoglycan teichoic acid transferase